MAVARKFEGKVVIVTGASRGIGAAAAAAFAREGATVIGVARSEMPDTAKAAKEAGGTFEEVRFDFCDAKADGIGKLVDQIAQRHGKIDVLLNNVGTIRRGTALEFTEQDWDDVLCINLRSPFFLSQAVARWWVTGGGREKAPAEARLKMINIASMLSFQGGIRVISYTAAKHGIAGITKGLANEWAAERINVNAVAPGYIATENTAPLRAEAVRNQAILDRIPQGGWGSPDDIAGTCMFLASPEADYLNGAVINVDGGWLAR